MGTPVHCCCGALPAVFSPAVVLLDKTSQGLFLHKYLPKKPKQTPNSNPVLPTRTYFSPWLLLPGCPPNISEET